MVNPANPKRAAASMLSASRDARGGHLAPHRGSVGSYSRAMGAAAAAVMAAVSGSTEDSSPRAPDVPLHSLQRVPMASLSYRDTILSIVRSSPYEDHSTETPDY